MIAPLVYPIFVSVLTYDLSRRWGAAAASEFNGMCARPSDPRSLPAARVVARLASLTEVQVYHGASSSLPKARSRAAAAAHAATAPYWVMCDDDVDCTLQTLRDLISIAGPPTEPTISVLPCLLRGDVARVNCEFDPAAPALVDFMSAAWKRPITRGGCGLMVVTRAAIDRMFDRYADELGYTDDDGHHRVALFQPLLLRQHDGAFAHQWLGEDYSFCERARSANVPIYALMQGISSHDGQALELDSLPR